jgi:hypothetical protein
MIKDELAIVVKSRLEINPSHPIGSSYPPAGRCHRLLAATG